MQANIILFVCVANYCRSPVAEKLFNENNNSDYCAESAGLIDFRKDSMDNRSAKFLENLFVNDVGHTTRKIDKKLIEKSLFIYALDKAILNELRMKFPDSYAKFKLISSEGIEDPINKEGADYLATMSQIEISIKELKGKF